MLKKGIILIIIILAVIFAVVLIFASVFKPTGQPETASTGTNFFSGLFPSGERKTDGQIQETPADISGYLPPSDNAKLGKERLSKVSSMPIAGYGIFMKERYMGKAEEATEPPSPLGGSVAKSTEFVPALRYAERATGNVYQTFADKIEERKLTSTVIPQVYEASFGEDSILMRYLKEDAKTIETFAGKLPKEILGGDAVGPTEMEGSFLPENIIDLSLSPDKLLIFYLFKSGDNAVGITASAKGDQKNQIFSSPFTEWLSQWPNARMITLNTKPSSNSPGYLYSIDPSTKRMTKILGGINGLTSLTSPSGKSVLYTDSRLSLFAYDPSTKNSVSLGIRTLPEKCVWDKASIYLYCAVPKNIKGTNYPDIWYRGEVSFSDEVLKINTENGNTTKLADPAEFQSGEEMDGIKLSLDQAENYLFFINKKDSFLWELNLK